MRVCTSRAIFRQVNGIQVRKWELFPPSVFAKNTPKLLRRSRRHAERDGPSLPRHDPLSAVRPHHGGLGESPLEEGALERRLAGRFVGLPRQHRCPRLGFDALCLLLLGHLQLVASRAQLVLGEAEEREAADALFVHPARRERAGGGGGGGRCANGGHGLDHLVVHVSSGVFAPAPSTSALLLISLLAKRECTDEMYRTLSRKEGR